MKAVDHLLKGPEDKETVDVLIWKTKNEVLARYVLESTNETLGISGYQLSNLTPRKVSSNLPTIEELEKGLNAKKKR